MGEATDAGRVAAAQDIAMRSSLDLLAALGYVRDTAAWQEGGDVHGPEAGEGSRLASCAEHQLSEALDLMCAAVGTLGELFGRVGEAGSSRHE